MPTYRIPTIFDNHEPPTAEELAKWESQRRKEALELTFKKLGRLNPNLVGGRAKGARENTIRATQYREIWKQVYSDLTKHGENNLDKIVRYIQDRDFGRMKNGKVYAYRTIYDYLATVRKATKQ